MRIGIAGGGLIGSLLAWRVGVAGAAVEVFDSGPKQRCSTVAAGMVSTTAELARAEPQLGRLGKESLALWQTWLNELAAGELLHANGSVLVAWPRDLAELDRVASVIKTRTSDPEHDIIALGNSDLAALEPELSHLPRAYFLPHEGAVDGRRLLPLLQAATVATGGRWHDCVKVEAIAPGALRVDSGRISFDWVCDCRGWGGRDRLPLRAVRGEIIRLHAPEVNISRPVRMVHPHRNTYLVPRRNSTYLVGASEIESDDSSPISVRTTLDLLSAAYALHASFAEARITSLDTGLRPAMPDNLPTMTASPGLISINGMYRHGFLTGPALVAAAINKMGLVS